MCQWVLIRNDSGNITLDRCKHPAALVLVVKDKGGDIYPLYTCLGCMVEVSLTTEYKILLSRELTTIPFNGEQEVTTIWEMN